VGVYHSSRRASGESASASYPDDRMHTLCGRPAAIAVAPVSSIQSGPACLHNCVAVTAAALEHARAEEEPVAGYNMAPTASRRVAAAAPVMPRR
jgi:hypothetical protein